MPINPQVGESMQSVLPTVEIPDSHFSGCCMCDPTSSAINTSSAEYTAARNHLARLIQDKSHLSTFPDVGILPNPPSTGYDTFGGFLFNYKMRSLQNSAADEAPRRDSSVVALGAPTQQPQHLAQRLERLSLGQIFLGGPVITLTDVDGPASRRNRSNSETDVLDAQARRFLHVPQAEVSDEPMRPPM